MPMFQSKYDVPGLLYAIVLINGGLMGYMKRGSGVSAVAGLFSGLLAAFGAYKTSQNPQDVYVSLGVSLFLFVTMGVRFLRSFKFMPAGLGEFVVSALNALTSELVTLLSGVMMARYGVRLLD
ncbi:hypothetical protein P7C73_g6538, partial [Tremellales sp. Uapishka_1]